MEIHSCNLSNGDYPTSSKVFAPDYPSYINMAAKPLIVPALKRHTATVIVAHGLGDSGAGWYASTL
jgi:hypothetical protein